jgi:hypothetical protein
MITKIEVENYRCFPRLSVDCGPYQVLAGANGAGKSTLLDIVPLVGDLLDAHRVTDAFLQRVGSRQTPRATTLAELPYRGTGDAIAFALEAELPDTVVNGIAEASLASLNRPLPTHLRYELLLDVSPYELSVAEEYLFLLPGPGVRRTGNAITLGDNAAYRELIPLGRPVGIDRVLQSPDWQSVISRAEHGYTRFTVETTASGTELPPLAVRTSRLALGSVPPDPTLFPAALWFAELLRSETVFYDPTWADLRRPAPPGDPARLLPSGRNTPWLALRLRQTDRDRFDSWVDHVRTGSTSGHPHRTAGTRGRSLRLPHRGILQRLPGDVLGSLGWHSAHPGVDPAAVPSPGRGTQPARHRGAGERHPPAGDRDRDAIVELDLRKPGLGFHALADGARANRAPTRARHPARSRRLGIRHSRPPAPQTPKLRDWQGSLDLGTLFAAGVMS